MKLIVLAAGLGTRMHAVTGGRPKHFLEVGGMTLIERLGAMAAAAGLEPVVVTRPEFVAEFRRTGMEVQVEDDLSDMMVTLSNIRRWMHEAYAWVGGDMVLTDFAPVREIVRAHLAHGSEGSYLYARTDRFKAKLTLSPDPQMTPEVIVTREGSYPYSILNFGVHSPRMHAYLPGDFTTPRGTFLQVALERGEPVLFREYLAPVFEIDRPADLAAARDYFELRAQAS
jgi:choline kinase